MGSSYAIANFQRNYYDSLTFCNEYGAFLTTISGRDEFDFVSTRFARPYTSRYVMSETRSLILPCAVVRMPDPISLFVCRRAVT